MDISLLREIRKFLATIELKGLKPNSPLHAIAKSTPILIAMFIFCNWKKYACQLPKTSIEIDMQGMTLHDVFDELDSIYAKNPFFYGNFEGPLGIAIRTLCNEVDELRTQVIQKRRK